MNPACPREQQSSLLQLVQLQRTIRILPLETQTGSQNISSGRRNGNCLPAPHGRKLLTQIIDTLRKTRKYLLSYVPCWFVPALLTSG